MKRSEKKVLTAIMERPSSFDQLCSRLRLPFPVLEEALNVLLKAGDIHYVAGKYCINKVSRDNVARGVGVECPPAPAEKPKVTRLALRGGKLVEERGEGLLQEPVVVEDKPIAEWLKNPPQPEPRWLRERKTRRRDRE